MLPKLAVWLVLPMLALTACAGSSLEPQPTSRRNYVQDFASPAAFPRFEQVLAGWSEASAQHGWCQGDRMLFGMRLVDGDEQQRWLLLLEVLSAERVGETFYWDRKENDDVALVYASDLLEVQVTILAADTLSQLGQSNVRLPADLLSSGVLTAMRYAVQAQGTKRELTEAQEKEMGRALAQLMAVMKLIRNDSVLSNYLWKVVEKPGVFSVVANFGVDVDIVAEMDHSRLIDRAPPHIPVPGGGGIMPFRIDVNDGVALYGEVMAVDPNRPRALSGGIVGLRAGHPKRSDLQLDVVLLAARRGDDG